MSMIMMYGGIQDWVDKVIGGILKAFNIGSISEGGFNYIGMDVSQRDDDIIIINLLT